MSDKSPYTIKVEDAGPARKRVSVTIASATVDTQLQQQLAAVSANVQLPGFRKGKVPRAVVEKRFGQAIGDETRNEIVKEALQEAISEHELDLLNNPEPSDETMPVVEPGKDFSFSVEMDIVPAFDLPDFGSIEIRKPLLEVTDEMINEEIERQCMRNGKGETLQDGFQPGDRMLGHASVLPKGEDEPVFTSENILVVLPEAGERGQVLGLLIDSLYDSYFKDASVGDTITIEVDAPDNHEREDVRGKTLVITYQLQVAERIEPLTIDQLVEAYSLGTTEVLNDQIKLAMEQRRDEEQATILRDQARMKLAEELDIEIPEKLSSYQVANQLESLRMRFMQQGLEADEVETKVAEAREDTERMATVGIKNMFIQRKVIKQYGIQVNEQEINAQIATLAAQRGVRPMEMHAHLAQTDQLRQLGAQIIENKAVDAMVQQMNVVEVSAEDWQNEASGSATTSKKKTTKKKTTKKKTAKKKTAASGDSKKKKKTSKKSSGKKSGS